MYTTKRLLQHSIPKDATWRIKDYLADDVRYIPAEQMTGLHGCLNCGYHQVRIVYQQAEVYTVMCFKCHHAARFHARSMDEAKAIYNQVLPDDYTRMMHCIGGKKGYRHVGWRNYFSTGIGGDNPFESIPLQFYECETFYQGNEPNGKSYRVTAEGFRFLGYDMRDNWDYAKKIVW